MNSETKIRKEVFTQISIDKLEKAPICVFIDDGTTLGEAFERLGQTYRDLYKDETWLPTLLHELPCYPEILQDAGEAKFKTDVTAELTFTFYVQSLPMTHFI